MKKALSPSLTFPPYSLLCIHTPHLSQIQLINNLNALDSMMNKLSESMNVADSTSTSPSFDSIQPGLVCCALSDEQWYRVVVLEPPSTSTGDVSMVHKKYLSTQSLAHLFINFCNL